MCERSAAGVFQHAGISIHRQRFPSVPELIFHHAYVCVCVCVSHHRERERETVCGDLPESQASFPVILLRFKYFTCLMHVIWLISAGNCPQSVSKEETALRRDRHRERDGNQSVRRTEIERVRACVRACGICIPSTFSAAHRIIPLFPLILIYAAPESACACEDVLLLHALSLALSLVCRMNNMPSRGPLCRTDRNEREREIASSSVSLHTVFFAPACVCVWLKTSGVSAHRRLINWSIRHVQRACRLVRRERRSC